MDCVYRNGSKCTNQKYKEIGFCLATGEDEKGNITLSYSMMELMSCREPPLSERVLEGIALQDQLPPGIGGVRKE